MRILVTGGAGFIGSNLAHTLEQKGHDVVVLDNFLSGSFRNLVEFHGDVVAGGCDVRPAGRFDIISHQASITDTTVTDQMAMMRNNVEGFRTVLSWAAEWKARVVWASSAAVYGNLPAPMRESMKPSPLNVYGYSKLAMEHLARRWHQETKLPIVGLRYFNVYGPGEGHKGKFASMIYQLAQQMKKGNRPRIFHDGGQRRDFVWIGDVLAANLLAMQAQGCHVCNVGSGKAESFNTVIAELNSVLKTCLEPDYFPNPYDFFQKHTEADISLTWAALGYAPEVGLQQGVQQYHASGAL